MTAFRCTAKLLKSLKCTPEPDVPAATNCLGDWTANVLRYGRKPYVIAVAEHSRLMMLVEAAPYKTLADRFLEELPLLLNYLCVPDELIEAELKAMQPLTVAKTNSRSVLASINQYDFALCCHLEQERLSAIDFMKRMVEDISKPNDYELTGDAARARFGLEPIIGPARREEMTFERGAFQSDPKLH